MNANRVALFVVIAHAAIVALHSAAHQVLDVRASTAQTVFIVSFIIVAPLVAGGLLWRRASRAGALVLAISLAGSLLFGVYNHFVAESPDHVAHVSLMSPGSWAIIFQATAVLLALSEALGIYAGVRVLRKNP
jgi:Na+/proline symporter